jgi:hypothetical protein
MSMREEYSKLTSYQKFIFNSIRYGSKLVSSEGENYKCCLDIHGNKKMIRRNSAEIVCDKMKEYLIFGDNEGIIFKKPKRKQD